MCRWGRRSRSRSEFGSTFARRLSNSLQSQDFGRLISNNDILNSPRGKTISYLYEDHRLLEGPDRSAGGVPADGPCRTGAGVRSRASRSWGRSPRPACGSAEPGAPPLNSGPGNIRDVNIWPSVQQAQKSFSMIAGDPMPIRTAASSRTAARSAADSNANLFIGSGGLCRDSVDDRGRPLGRLAPARPTRNRTPPGRVL
jgi:hypothetical protein